MSLRGRDWQTRLIYPRLGYRCGSQTEEPSGGGRRSSAIKGGQGVWLPVHRAKPLWPLPSTRPSIIISSTAAAQGPCWVRLSRPCPATAPCQFSHLESSLFLPSRPPLIPACCLRPPLPRAALTPLRIPPLICRLRPQPTPTPGSYRPAFQCRSRSQEPTSRPWVTTWVSTGPGYSELQTIAAGKRKKNDRKNGHVTKKVSRKQYGGHTGYQDAQDWNIWWVAEPEMHYMFTNSVKSSFGCTWQYSGHSGICLVLSGCLDSKLMVGLWSGLEIGSIWGVFGL